MPYTKRPKVTRNLQGEVRDEENERGKSKAKKIIVPESLKQYYLERDRIIYKTCNDEETRKAILERYGIKN